MTEPYHYQTEVEWAGGRMGTMRSRSLPDIRVAAPPEFKGHEGAWTPEHLFVASMSSCFMTTFLAIAELSKLEFISFGAVATGKLEKVEGRGYLMTGVVIRPRLVIRRAQDAERAARILAKAERNCLISNSVTATVRLEPTVEVASEVQQGLAVGA